MRSSSVIPWLFFGPLFGTMASYGLFRLTGWRWAEVTCQVLLAFTCLVLLGAALPGFVWYWRQRGRKSTEKRYDNPTLP